MDNPIEQFVRWWRTAEVDAPSRQPGAACMSTIGRAGFPNAGFVGLKAVDSNGFKFCTYLDSVKGRAIANNPKVAITVRWDHVGYQARITGVAERLSEQEAYEYWAKRSPEAQLVTTVFEQSSEVKSEQHLFAASLSRHEASKGWLGRPRY